MYEKQEASTSNLAIKNPRSKHDKISTADPVLDGRFGLFHSNFTLLV